jgi:AmmeMemoRadiSam system protein A
MKFPNGYRFIRFVFLSMATLSLLVQPTFSQTKAEEKVHPKTFTENKTKKGSIMAPEGLNEEEGKALLAVARETIDQTLFHREGKPMSPKTHSPKYLEQRGTFVTLTIHGQLRGCIGHIIPQESLLEGIQINAINAAFRDPRFRPLSKEEWKNVKIEISILTEPTIISYDGPEDLLEKLTPGVDGVIIQKGMHQSTFLPQVWEQLGDKVQFMTHLCMKAGLDGDDWKTGDLVVSTYQVQAFEEE